MEFKMTYVTKNIQLETELSYPHRYSDNNETKKTQKGVSDRILETSTHQMKKYLKTVLYCGVSRVESVEMGFLTYTVT